MYFVYLPFGIPSHPLPPTSILFSFTSGSDFGKQQIFRVTLQVEQIQPESMTQQHWLVICCLSLVNFQLSFTRFYFRLCSVIQHMQLQVLTLFFSLEQIALCTHRHTHTLPEVSQSVRDSFTHHLTEWLVRMLIPACIKYCHLLSVFATSSQTVNQTGWRLSGVPLIKTSQSSNGVPAQHWSLINTLLLIRWVR